jgi:hypothetical protein
VADRAVFTSGAADRIAKVVRIVEAGNRNTSYMPPPPRGVGSGGPGLRLCTFTGSWSIGSSKTLTIKGQTSTPNTVSAINLHLGLSPDAQCDVLIGRAGTAWYLVNANMSQQPNYDASAGTQAFTIVSGDMEWADVQACPSEDASPQSLSFFYG